MKAIRSPHLDPASILDPFEPAYLMPDFKFWNRETAKRLAKAPDYPQRAREAIQEMHRQVGPLKFALSGLARRGVLVRHLVMPGQSDEAAEIFRWLSNEVSPDTYVNITPQAKRELKWLLTVKSIAESGYDRSHVERALAAFTK